MSNKITLKMTVEVEVDLAVYAEAYGFASPGGALDDAREHVSGLVQEGAAGFVAQTANGSRVVGVENVTVHPQTESLEA